MRVTEAGRRVVFRHRTHFPMRFKDATGLTPLEWLRLQDGPVPHCWRCGRRSKDVRWLLCLSCRRRERREQALDTTCLRRPRDARIRTATSIAA